MTHVRAGSWIERTMTHSKSQFRVEAYGRVYSNNRPIRRKSSGR